MSENTMFAIIFSVAIISFALFMGAAVLSIPEEARIKLEHRYKMEVLRLEQDCKAKTQ